MRYNGEKSSESWPVFLKKYSNIWLTLYPGTGCKEILVIPACFYTLGSMETDVKIGAEKILLDLESQGEKVINWFF